MGGGSSSERYLRADSLSPQCYMNNIGYKPTQMKVTVGQVQAPVATSQTNYVKTFAGKGTLIANGGMHTSNVVNGLKIYENSGFKAVRSFSKFAPVFASSLGVMGVVFGIIVDASKPSMAELMEKTNQLFENFAKEVNLRLAQLKGYVDVELITLERRLMYEDYKDISSTWTNCGELYKADISMCLKLAMIKILAQAQKFLKYEKELLKAGSGSLLPESQVRVIEANFPTFANYAFLALTNLDVLASTYEDQTNVLRQYNQEALQNYSFDETRKHYFRLYAEKFVNLTTRFKTYQQKAIAQFKKLHIKNKCQETTVCVTVQEQSTAYRNSRKKENVYKCSCKFDPTLPAGHCEFKAREFIRSDGGWTTSYRKTSEDPEALGREKVRQKSVEYSNAIAAKIDEEWKQNILDLSQWDNAKEDRIEQLATLDELEGSAEEPTENVPNKH